jgi:phosphohistidine phosphatase
MTSRTLVIMRHAKAEQSETLPDIKRALTQRGRDDARAAGAWLAAEHLAPDVVLCSPSIRTRGTWHEVAIGLAEADATVSPTVRYEDALYAAGVNAALEVIRELPDDARVALLIGHNPTVSALSLRLDEGAARSDPGLKTAGLAVHEVATGWASVAAADLTSAFTARG